MIKLKDLLNESDYGNSPIDKYLKKQVPNLSKEQAYEVVRIVKDILNDISPKMTPIGTIEDGEFFMSTFGNNIVELYFEIGDTTIKKHYDKKFQRIISDLKGLKWTKRVVWESTYDTATIIIHIK